MACLNTVIESQRQQKDKHDMMGTTRHGPRYSGLGRKIRRLRQQRAWTQKVLANAVGVSEASLSLYERDIQLPPLDTLGLIADALGVPVKRLLPPC